MSIGSPVTSVGGLLLVIDDVTASVTRKLNVTSEAVYNLQTVMELETVSWYSFSRTVYGTMNQINNYYINSLL